MISRKLESINDLYRKYLTKPSIAFIVINILTLTSAYLFQVKSLNEGIILQVASEVAIVHENIVKEVAINDQEGIDNILQQLIVSYKLNDAVIATTSLKDDFFSYYLGNLLISWDLLNFSANASMPIDLGKVKYNLILTLPVKLFNTFSILPVLFFLVFSLIFLGRSFLMSMRSIQHSVIDPLNKLNQYLGNEGNIDVDDKDFIWTLETYSLYEAIGELKKAQIETKRLAEYETIAKTTQMVAHDVRKPFSMIKLVIYSLQSASSWISIKNQIDTNLPKIDNTILRVERMLDDIIEISRKSPIVKSEESTTSIIRAAINDCENFSKEKVEFSLSLHHQKKLFGDAVKLQRLFANIIHNAIQHSNNRVVYVESSKTEDNQLRFLVGNYGEIISQDILNKIFDSFVSSYRTGGSGLGLAIARKIVVDHGGRIECKSPGEKYDTEFIFYLPFHDSEDIDYNQNNPIKYNSRQSYQSLLKTFQNEGHRFTIGVLEDEDFYSQYIVRLIKDSELKNSINVQVYETGEALLTSNFSRFNLIICDVDLSSSSYDGFSITKILREKGFNGLIVIHSNRTTSQDTKTSVEVGADYCIPKPITLDNLIAIISSKKERN